MEALAASIDADLERLDAGLERLYRDWDKILAELKRRAH
jgi:hypothetical protein